MAVLSQYSWLIAIISIAFILSGFGNGANDVANSYATTVAARTLTLAQAGVLSVITEFVGAVALGANVTNTIKNGIIGLDRFRGDPATLILAMTCAEIGNATWLMVATRLGFPVSTTHTVVGALVGVGIASEASITWRWTDGSISQIAASWGIAPLISAAFAAILFLTLKFSVLERKDPLKWGMRLIPLYLAFTGAVLALFIVVEAPTTSSLEEFGAGRSTAIILGVFAGVLAVSYVFFLPYFHRRLILEDARIQVWHIPLGPLLWKDDCPLYFPGAPDGDIVKDHYLSARQRDQASFEPTQVNNADPESEAVDHSKNIGTGMSAIAPGVVQDTTLRRKGHEEPEERFLAPTQHLAIYHPARIWSWVKYIFLQGVTRDCVLHDSKRLEKTHALAKQYSNKVEHLWTYAQVASAIMMSIAHGSNDVANAVGPWAAAYSTYQAGFVETKSPTPIWILAVAGLLVGAGFWVMGWRIVKALGNRITQMSPSRGYSIELGAAITVLLASRLGLPVSTTHCLTGAAVGVSLMNFNLGATNWRQLAFIFFGWVITLPAAGLISGLLMLMAVNTPHFT